jgi:hypothetical protein
MIDMIKSEVDLIRAQGHESVVISSLLAYLESLKTLDKDPNVLDTYSIEQFRALHQANLSGFEKFQESHLELYRSMINSGQAAMKTTVLINGGAAVSLLAFVGHLIASAKPTIVPRLAFPLTCFVVAVLCGAMAFGLTYVTLSSIVLKKIARSNKSNALAIAFVVVSYVLFGLGSYFAYQIFRSL